MTISLQSLLPIPIPERYKVHLACWNGENQPLDVFVQDRAEWEKWNTWRSQRDDFNRDFILALIDFYPEQDTWLFGGVYRIIARSPKTYAHSYKVKLVPDSADLIGRLKISMKRPSRAKSLRLETYYPKMIVSELLRETYSGERFPGYENIALDFGFLESIIRSNRPDWKAALENVKGIYLITDNKNGRKYVGSAYGDAGVWSRWSCYVGTGHGWNDELVKLIKAKGISYARKNFRFALLEHRAEKTADKVIIEREGYWKDALLSRGKWGYNKN